VKFEDIVRAQDELANKLDDKNKSLIAFLVKQNKELKSQNRGLIQSLNKLVSERDKSKKQYLEMAQKCLQIEREHSELVYSILFLFCFCYLSMIKIGFCLC
jgi:phage shock protein A